MMQKVAKRPKPLWLRILIGFSLAIVMVMAAVFTLIICLQADAGKCRDEEGIFQKLACGFAVTYYSFAPLFRNLPSDEEMIEHSYKHRSDFQRLAQIYGEDLSVPCDDVGTLLPTPEIEAIMARINVPLIYGDWSTWMPADSNSQDNKPQEDRLEPRSYHGAPRQFRGVNFHYAKVQTLSGDNLIPVYKWYYYVPLAPKVVNGRLRTPNQKQVGYLLQSLNAHMPAFDTCDCNCKDYRLIETHWYIGMCRAGRPR
jgi:hypothetical protein